MILEIRDVKEVEIVEETIVVKQVLYLVCGMLMQLLSEAAKPFFLSLWRLEMTYYLLVKTCHKAVWNVVQFEKKTKWHLQPKF